MSYLNEMAIQFHSKDEMNTFIKDYKHKLDNQIDKLDKDYLFYDDYLDNITVIENDGEPVIYFGLTSFYRYDPCNVGINLLFDMVYDYGARLIRIGESQDDIEIIDENDPLNNSIILNIGIYGKVGNLYKDTES